MLSKTLSDIQFHALFFLVRREQVSPYPHSRNKGCGATVRPQQVWIPVDLSITGRKWFGVILEWFGGSQVAAITHL